MKKIEYFDNCATVYLETLGLLNKGRYTDCYRKLDKIWKNIKKNYHLSNLPEDVKELIISPYEKLVDYFIYLIGSQDFEQIKKEFKRKRIFKYNKFKNKIAKFFITNADKMNIYSCYYCDAAYTGIYQTEEEKNTETKRTFDVDHFFPKEKYPMFSLSLYNLVPSCQVCNSRVKGSKDFFDFYNLKKNDDSLKKELLKISPTSEKYNFENSVLIQVLPQKSKDNEDNEWHYSPDFLKDIESYKIHFDVNKQSAYFKVVEAMRLQERYNNIAIKSHALYLANLRKKYPDSHIHFISEIFRKSKVPISEEKIKEDIFHQNDKYALLQKMRDDIIENISFER